MGRELDRWNQIVETVFKRVQRDGPPDHGPPPQPGDDRDWRGYTEAEQREMYDLEQRMPRGAQLRDIDKMMDHLTQHSPETANMVKTIWLNGGSRDSPRHGRCWSRTGPGG